MMSVAVSWRTRIAAITLTLVAALTGTQALAAETYTEGKEYKRLAQTVATRVPEGEHEVVALFWYGCPHCYRLDPYLTAWAQKLPADVHFVHLPAVLNPSWELHARAYHAGEALGVQDQAHKLLFDRIHQAGQPMASEQALADFYADLGVDQETFKKTLYSFGVESQLRQQAAQVRAYRVMGVPAVIVDGQYLVDIGSAGGEAKVTQVIDYLLQKD